MRPRSTDRAAGAPRARRALVSLAVACVALVGLAAAGEGAANPHRADGAAAHGAVNGVDRAAGGEAADARATNGMTRGAAHDARVLSAEERLLVDALELVGAGDVDGALLHLEDLIGRREDFKLAQLVYADLLATKTRPLDSFGDIDGSTGEDLAALREEALARLRHELTRASRAGLPESLIDVAARHRQVIVVDVSAARLYLFENVAGEPRLVADYYVSTGRKGAGKVRQNDQRTPVGVYFITGRIDGGDLPEFYGAGALPVDYPNPWDRRLEHTGYGIWIHGMPAGTYGRAPFASDGCIALVNTDLDALWARLVWEPVPVVIADAVSWWPRATLAARRKLLAERIEQWRAAWQSGDEPRYAAFYSPDFESEGRDRATWLRLHRGAAARQHDVAIEVSDASLIGFPGDHRVVIATFDQSYRSADRVLDLRKQQYWRLDGDGVWRILYEGAARVRREHLKGIPIWARSKMY